MTGTPVPTIEPAPGGKASYLRSYFSLVGSSFVSNTGNAFTNLAIPIFVFETTGSAAQTGIVAVANFAPQLISSVFGGALVDRVGRKRMLLFSEGLNVVGTGAIPLLHMLGLLNFPLLILLVAIGAILDSPGRAARGSMIPLFATRAGFSPERAQVMNQSGFFIAQTLGPALAGITIGIWGPTTAIWIDSISFAISFLIVLALVDNPQSTTKSRPTTYRDDLTEGFRFVMHDPFLRSTVIFITYLTMFYVPLFSVLYPVYFTQEVNSTKALGVFVGLETVGIFISNIFYGWWGDRFSRWKVLIASQFAGLPFFWLLVFTPSVPVLWFSAFMNGLLTGPLNSVIQVALQVRTPDEMRPRVNSLVSAGSLIAVPIGALLMGAMIETIGVVATFAFVAAFYTIGPILVALFPVFRKIDEDLPEAELL